MPAMPGHLEGMIAIVSGAGSSGPGVGTGKAISILFAKEGAKVLLLDKFEDRAAETLQSIEEAGGTAAPLIVDITAPDAGAQVATEAIRVFGGADILVNNAGIGTMLGVVDTSPELYHDVMTLNVTAPFMLAKAVIPIMIERGGGAIVNITSLSAIRNSGVGQTVYAMSKAALIGMTVDIASAYGRQGVRINSIAPGNIVTPIRDSTALEVGVDTSKLNLGARTALGFEGDAWDIARAALFLASSDARFITGVHLPVDGGTSVRAPTSS